MQGIGAGAIDTIETQLGMWCKSLASNKKSKYVHKDRFSRERSVTLVSSVTGSLSLRSPCFLVRWKNHNRWQRDRKKYDLSTVRALSLFSYSNVRKNPKWNKRIPFSYLDQHPMKRTDFRKLLKVIQFLVVEIRGMESMDGWERCLFIRTKIETKNLNEQKRCCQWKVVQSLLVGVWCWVKVPPFSL